MEIGQWPLQKSMIYYYSIVKTHTLHWFNAINREYCTCWGIDIDGVAHQVGPHSKPRAWNQHQTYNNTRPMALG